MFCLMIKMLKVEIIAPYGITNDYRITYKRATRIEYHDFLVEDGKFTSRLDAATGRGETDKKVFRGQ